MQTAKFAIGKGDYQINGANRLTARWIQFHNDAPYNSGGGTATLERATELPRRDGFDRRSARLVVRVQQAERAAIPVRAPAPAARWRTADSGTGPAITIATPAIAFGGPVAGTGQGNAGFDFKQNITQVIDNFTYIRAAHSYKFGFDLQHIYDEPDRRSAVRLHVPDDRGVPGGEERRGAARLHDHVADHRRPGRST